MKPLSENTMLYALYRMGYHSKATVHGFQAVFSTMANEKGFDGDVIEKALAHEQRNKVRAAYHIVFQFLDSLKSHLNANA